MKDNNLFHAFPAIVDVLNGVFYVIATIQSTSQPLPAYRDCLESTMLLRPMNEIALEPSAPI